MIPDRAVLALVALPFNGSEGLFAEGLRARRGIHLRWSFRPELGFPPGGFSLYRSTQPGYWGDPIARVNLPANASEALGRIVDDLVPASEARRRYEDGAPELIDVLGPLLDPSSDVPMHLRPLPTPPSAEEATVAHLFALDVLLVASLDPFFARMLGLYWIDERVTYGAAYIYKVVGHWASHEWPIHEIDLTGVSPLEAADGELEADGLQIFAGARGLSAVSAAEDEFYGPYLRVQSDDPELPLHIVFPIPVAEASLRIEVSGTDPGWTAEADGRPTTLAVDGSRLVVRASDGATCRRLDLSGADPSWRLYQVGYREHLGPLGNLESEPVGIRAAASDGVLVPRISELKAATVPPALGSGGSVGTHRSRVEIACYVSASPVELYRPVRMHVGRSPAGHLGEPVEVLTRLDGPAGPVLYQPPHAEPVLPELLAEWDFDGDTGDRKSGRVAVLRGSGGFVHRHPLSPRRRALSLRGAGFVEAADWPQFEFLGACLTLDAWVLPRRGPGDATIIGNDRDRSIWLGLRPQGEGHRVEVTVNGHPFASSGTVSDGRWARVTAVYDGSDVLLYVNGEQDSEHAAALGPVLPNPDAVLCIGADSGSTEGAPIQPFSGCIAEVRIWKAPLHPDEADDRLGRARQDLATRVASADLVAAWPGLLDFSADAPLIQASDRPELSAIGREFTLQAWLNPRPGQDFPTIVGNNWGQSFWLGLLRVDERTYRARFWLNRPDSPTPADPFHSSGAIPANHWTHVTVTYDGRQVRFYIDRVADSAHPADLGPVRDNPDGRLVAGAESGSRPGDLEFPFAGMLADVRVWRRALAPAEAEGRLTRSQFGDHRLADGEYTYWIQGIDLFGRVSDWSEPRTISVIDRSPPPPPVNLRARYLPLAGRVVESSEGTARTDIEVPAAFPLADLVGYDAVVERAATGGPPDFHRQSFELEGAEIDAGRLSLTLRTPPFAQLRPQVGDTLRIEFDWRLEVTWAFAGRQCLFFPNVTEFHVFRRPGPLNTLRGTVREVATTGRGTFSVETDLTLPGAPDALAGMSCQVGTHRYELVGHSAGSGSTIQLRYSAAPTIAPKIGDPMQIPLTPDAPTHTDFDEQLAWGSPEAAVPLAAGRIIEAEPPAETAEVAPEERAALREAGVTWLPEQNLHRILLRDPRPLESLGEVSPADFVPGVLVARTPGTDANPWHVFTVLWHDWAPEEQLALYVVSEDGDPVPHRLLDARYHPGERYRIVLEGGTPPVFAPGVATTEHVIGLSTVHLGGNQSGISGPVTVVAVDRRRPPPPSRPVIARIGRADYYGQSRVSIRWEAPTSPQPLAFLLYRANDSAIFTRDLEQRRLRTGYYRGHDPREIVADDIDFADWLAVMFPAETEAGRWRTSLFAERADRAFDHATPIWRAWADRFYPALTNEEVRDLAERLGNETAFALVHERPLQGTSYTDSVNGLVRNRYLYRLRTQSPSALQSTEWSHVSDPAAPPRTKPPRAPVPTRVEAGERKIILHWTLNSESDITEYRVYRSERREDLEDFRSWSEASDPRLIATIRDPRLKVIDRSVLVPAALGVQEILGVYRIDEFDPTRRPLVDQPAALNYYKPRPPINSEFDLTTQVVQRLRRVADGVIVALVYRDTSHEVQMVKRAGREPPYEDTGLPAFRDSFYRLIAVDVARNISPGSQILRGRAIDLAPPAPPVWERAEWTRLADGAPAVTLAWRVDAARTRSIVRRRVADTVSWAAISPWLDGDEAADGDRTRQWFDHQAAPGERYEYQIRVANASGNVGSGPPIIVEPARLPS